MKSKRRLVTVVVAACALSGCGANAPAAPEVGPPVVLTSSADFGCLRSGSPALSRLVQMRNTSAAPMHIARWSVSCDCLSVEPASINIPAEGVIYVQLVFDPTKEGDTFVGDLRMSAEGFGPDGERLAFFDVPVSVIAPEALQAHAQRP